MRLVRWNSDSTGDLIIINDPQASFPAFTLKKQSFHTLYCYICNYIAVALILIFCMDMVLQDT